MPVKITIIGAGGYVFPLRLVGDILSHSALQDAEIALMDINPTTLARTEHSVRELIDHHRLGAKVWATTDRPKALEAADFVIVTFQVGGLEAYRLDVEIPRKYGLDQPVGDTLGPGGVMRFLRSSVAYREIALDMLEVCPEALLINYANPMAMNCWYLSELGIKTVGLCHSVQNTTHMLAQQLGIPLSEINFKSAGINHQAWITEFRRGDQDLLPQLRIRMRETYLEQHPDSDLDTDYGDHSSLKLRRNTYEGGQEAVRSWLMETFGYFHTESSHHASEYTPWFRKNPQAIQQLIPERWDYYQICSSHSETGLEELLERLKNKLEPSLEYGSWIIRGCVTGEPQVIYGNVPNRDLITNLPEGCCVEVACLADKNGLQPTHYGPLPPQLAALNRTNINVQELAVRAALEGNLEYVYHAIALDPLTGALLNLEQIRAMTTELLQAQRAWLPETLQLN